MAIRIKRSSGDTAPATLAAGQLAYSEGSTNGGTLYYGEIGGTVRAIAGKKYIDKLNGIAAGAIANVVEDTTPQLGGALDVNGQSITSASGGNVTIQPNGDGLIFLGTSSNSAVLVGKGTAASYLGGYNSYDFTIGANVNNALGASVTLKPGSNGNVELYPLGTGKVVASASSTQLGTGSAAASLTTNGAYNLTLDTNNGTNSSNLVFSNGVNGSITATMNGNSAFIVNNSSSTFSPIVARNTATASSSIGQASITLTKVRSDILLAAMTDEPVTQNFSVRDSGNNNRIFGRLVATYAGTSTNPSFDLKASVNGFSSTLQYAQFLDAGLILGGTTSQAITTGGSAANLTLSTNAGTNSGSIAITAGSNNNITLTPHGTGKVVIAGDLQVTGTTTSINSTTLDVTDLNITVAKGASSGSAANGAGLTVEGPTTAATILYASSDDSWRLNKLTYLSGIAYPSSDGSANQFLKTNGSGVLSFASITQATGTELQNVVEDTTPQLGGSLDVNGNSIVSASNGNIAITPNGTGSIVLDGLNWPQADGTANQVLKTNGSGQLSWVTQTSGATAFTGLSDVPSSYTGSGSYFVRVNSAATALEFTQDIDDGTF